MTRPNTITSEYIHALQACYHRIERRGIKVNLDRLERARIFIDADVKAECLKLSSLWSCHVYVGAENNDGTDGSINLNASSGKRTPLLKMQSLGYVVPKISSRDEEGNYVSKESLNELALQKMYSTNQFNIVGGDPAIRSILRIRELVTIKNRYVNAALYRQNADSVFLSNYNCVGTLTGRRGSKQHVFGYGGNAQNFPKHGELASIYRRCLVARPGKIFLIVDQMQAEDYPVSALAGNTVALKELEDGIDRHTKLACSIFGLAVDSKSEKEWKDSMERFLGKKTRHANNYDMRGATMSDSLAKEGFGNYGPISLSATGCQAILDKVNQIEPLIKGVFHAEVRMQLDATRTLRTPFNRERQFFGLRAGDFGSNNKIYREAYAYVPQSVIGDNTGFAVYRLEGETRDKTGVFKKGQIIQEGHDSIVQEVDANADVIWASLQNTITAFDRPITFRNGITINIPIEGELGFDFNHTVTFKSNRTKTKKLTDISYQDVQAALYKIQEANEVELQKDRDYAASVGNVTA